MKKLVFSTLLLFLAFAAFAQTTIADQYEGLYVGKWIPEAKGLEWSEVDIEKGIAAYTVTFLHGKDLPLHYPAYINDYGLMYIYLGTAQTGGTIVFSIMKNGKIIPSQKHSYAMSYGDMVLVKSPE